VKRRMIGINLWIAPDLQKRSMQPASETSLKDPLNSGHPYTFRPGKKTRNGEDSQHA
jgi:hypothetical protein